MHIFEKLSAALFGETLAEATVGKTKMQYRIYRDGDNWRYWIRVLSMDITIVCSKSFVSKEMANEHLTKVLKEMKWEIK